MRKRGIAVPIALALALALASCGSSGGSVMPDVVGKKLDVALSDIDRAGYSKDDVEILGGGTFGVIDKSNWEVCAQLPESGSAASEAPRLTVDRSCDDESPAPAESPTATESSTPVESPTASPAEPSNSPSDAAQASTAEPLTAATSADLAAVLAQGDYCSPAIADFADRYRGRTIAFDGSIGAMNPHGSAKTRYDLLIGSGDFSETTAPGPAFQFRDVNLTYDLHYVGSDTPGSIRVGTALHIVATVGEFLPKQGCLFLLEPVETSFR